MSKPKLIMRLLLLVCGFVLSGRVLLAQSTIFTYQGKLTDAGQPANGVFDLQFALFNALNGGAQQDVTLTREDVVVTNGVFTVGLDFGAGVFPGAARFLEISVRPGASVGAFTLLTPRQPMASTPYAIQSLNATNAGTAINFSGALAGDVTGTQGTTVIANNAVTTPKLADGSVSNAKIVSVDGSKITGTIPVAGIPAGSGNYIQNGAALQASSNFNISGNGFIGGNLGIGTTAPATKLQVNGDLRLGTSGTNGCVQQFAGGVIAGICSSDLRFKRDITPFANVLNQFVRLQPVHYYWRAAEFPQKHFGATQSYGLIAQDVAAVLPELVSEDEQGFKQVDYSKLPLLTMQAVKELKAENDLLKQQNAQQQQLLNALQGRLQTIERALAPKQRTPQRAARIRQPLRQTARH